MPALRWSLKQDGPARSSRREDDDTAALVAQIKNGEGHLFEPLYARYFDRVYGYLKVMLRDVHEAEDAAQQVFIQVFEALPRYELRKAPFRAWLFRIARNEGLMRLRKRGRADVSEPDAIERKLNAAWSSDGREADALADDGFAHLIKQVPDTQRQVLVLRYLLDMSAQEIATVIGRTPGAVRKLQHRAIRTLEAELEGDDRVPRTARRARVPMLMRLRRVPVLTARRFVLRAKAGESMRRSPSPPDFTRWPGLAPALGRHPYRSCR